MKRYRDGRLARLATFGTVLEPQEAIQPILSRPVRDALMAWLEEIWAEKELVAVNLQPRRRAFFSGPPGVGKTTLAHHLAARLGLTMVAVHSERIIDCYIGSSAKNIGSLFDIAEEDDSDPVMLFFDEFESVALRRKRAEHGADEERNSWVNTLLQRIERYRGFIIAATNHKDQIDPAIWRRFDIHMELDLPGQEERERILARYLSPFGLPRAAMSELAVAFETASPSLIRQWSESVKRNQVLGHKIGWDMRKEATMDRIVASVAPHPDAGKPRLWSLGAKDQAVRVMPWPLPKADEIKEDAPASAADSSNVVALAPRQSNSA